MTASKSMSFLSGVQGGAPAAKAFCIVEAYRTAHNKLNFS